MEITKIKLTRVDIRVDTSVFSLNIRVDIGMTLHVFLILCFFGEKKCKKKFFDQRIFFLFFQKSFFKLVQLVLL